MCDLTPSITAIACPAPKSVPSLFVSQMRPLCVHGARIHSTTTSSLTAFLIEALQCHLHGSPEPGGVKPRKEFRTREIQLGSHTMGSHGYAVARIHMHDWVILLLRVLIEITLYIIHPFYRFVGKDMMTDLKYPLKSNTVPVWAVPIYAVLLPMVIFLVVYIRRRDVYDLHHAILGLLFSILVTAVITEAIKDAVGRPRPDFFWRCFPDGKDDHLLVWGFYHCTYLEKYKYLIAKVTLQNFVLFFYHYFLLHLLAFLELMTTGTTGRTFLLEVF